MPVGVHGRLGVHLFYDARIRERRMNGQINALVRELITCEAQLHEVAWIDPTFTLEDRWQSAFEELNRFFSPLEIRKLIWEVQND
jgi:hypothetical protein